MNQSKKTKLLYVITKANWGGAQKYVYDLATALPKESFDVCVACGKEGNELVERLKANNLPIIRIQDLGRDVSIFNDLRVCISLIRIFKKEKPDIVHLNSSKIGALGALAARYAHIKKIVFTAHGFAFNEDRLWIQKVIIKCISWITIFLSTDTIVISKQELYQTKAWPFIKHKIHLVYNGIPQPQFLSKEKSRIILTSLLHQPTDFLLNKRVVLTIAELTANKGLIYSIQAIKETDFVYIIIGEGEQRSELEKVIIDNNLENQVFLVGHVPHASDLLKAADIFLLSSLKEGMPYVILEAALAQIPVISTNVGGIQEIITHTKSGFLIRTKNIDDIKQGFYFFSVHEHITTATHNLHKIVINTFSVDDMVLNNVMIYNIR